MADDELNKIAATAMTAVNNDRPKAAARMATHIMKRRDLIQQLALYYLTHADVRAAPEPSITVSPHKVKGHKRRTPEQRAAALEAAGEMGRAMRNAYDHLIDGRRLAELRWGELTRLCDQAKVAAASHLRLGTEQVENFILLDKIERHTNVTDHSQRIQDVITLKQAQVYRDEAVTEAPHWVDAGIHAYIDSLENLRTRHSEPKGISHEQH